MKFEQLEGGCLGATVTGVSDAVAANYDASAVGFRLLGVVTVDHLCVSDFLALVTGERVGSLHVFLG